MQTPSIIVVQDAICIQRKAQSFNLEIQEAIVSDENGKEIGECEEKSECENVKPCYTVDYKMKIRNVPKSKIEKSSK